MSYYFVYVALNDGKTYAKTILCNPSEIFSKALDESAFRGKLLSDMYADNGERATVEYSYLNREGETVQRLLQNLQRALESNTGGYFMCARDALSAGLFLEV